MTSEQDSFWSHSFGNDYISRNNSSSFRASGINFFSRALRQASALGNPGLAPRCIEFGPNIGINLAALNFLYPRMIQYGVEVNQKAAEELSKSLPWVNVKNESILNFKPDMQCDLVLAKTLLIHIHPSNLPLVYKTLYDSSSKYILIAEYYNPTPVMIEYRGHSNKLFKRDFCGELLDLYSEAQYKLKLLDYGFVYYRDPQFPQDDITWFLLEKES